MSFLSGAGAACLAALLLVLLPGAGAQLACEEASSASVELGPSCQLQANDGSGQGEDDGEDLVTLLQLAIRHGTAHSEMLSGTWQSILGRFLGHRTASEEAEIKPAFAAAASSSGSGAADVASASGMDVGADANAGTETGAVGSPAAVAYDAPGTVARTSLLARASTVADVSWEDASPAAAPTEAPGVKGAAGAPARASATDGFAAKLVVSAAKPLALALPERPVVALAHVDVAVLDGAPLVNTKAGFGKPDALGPTSPSIHPERAQEMAPFTQGQVNQAPAAGEELVAEPGATRARAPAGAAP